jgi:hypothetical protein
MRQVIQWRWRCDRCNKPVRGEYRVKDGEVVVDGWRLPRGYAGLIRRDSICPECAIKLWEKEA